MLKIKKVSKVLLVGFFVALFAIGVFGLSDRFMYAIRKQKVLFDRRAMAAKNMEIIRDGEKPSHEKGAALLQLAVYDQDDAFKLAREWIQLNDPYLVKAAIKSLKFSSDKGDEVLLFNMYKGLESHPEHGIYRDDLIRSLMEKPLSQESLYLMVEMPYTRQLEKVKIYGKLYAKETDPKRKSQTLAYLKGVGKNAKADELSQVILTLSEVAPEDPDLLEMHRKVAEKGLPDMLDYSVMHLAKLKDPWLVKNFKSLLQSKDEQQVEAALKAIGSFCPKDIISELDRIYFSKVPQNTQALVISAAAKYEDPAAQEFIKKALASPFLTESQRQGLMNRISFARSSKQKCP